MGKGCSSKRSVGGWGHRWGTVPESTQHLSLLLTALHWYSWPTCFLLGIYGQRVAVWKTRGTGQTGLEDHIESQAMWRTHTTDCAETACRDSAGDLHLTAICAFNRSPKHGPWIQTQSATDFYQREALNGSKMLCHSLSPILLVREQFSRKQKVSNEHSTARASPVSHQAEVLREQNKASDTRGNCFVLTLQHSWMADKLEGKSGKNNNNRKIATIALRKELSGYFWLVPNETASVSLVGLLSAGSLQKCRQVPSLLSQQEEATHV